MSSILLALSGPARDAPNKPSLAITNALPPLTSASWSEARSRTLIELLQHQVQLGKRSESGFRREAWAEVTSEFIKKYHGQWSREQLKNHFQILKSQYNTVRELRLHPDFRWDDTSHMVTGSPEAWEEYLKSHPKAKLFRDRGFPLYGVLDKLVGDPSLSNRKRKASQAFSVPLSTASDVVVTQAEGSVQSTPRTVPPAEQTELVPLSSPFSNHVGTNLAPGGSETPSSLPRSDLKLKSRGQQEAMNGIVESIEKVIKLDEHRIKQEAHDLLDQKLESMIKQEKFPNMKEALGIFSQASNNLFDSPSQRMSSACVLRSEDNAAFFCSLPDDLRWEWLKREAGP